MIPHTDSSHRRRLCAALERLPDDLYRAIVLCDVEGRSYEEIALLTGCPVPAIKARVNRARRSLYRDLPRVDETTISSLRP